MNHSFDVDTAVAHGVHAAVLHQTIAFWVLKNKANGKHLHDGRHWTYNSAKAFTELFPYLSADQIQRNLKKLEEAGLVVVGCFNTSPYDRTRWYSTAEGVVIDSAKSRNEFPQDCGTYTSSNQVHTSSSSLTTFEKDAPKKPKASKRCPQDFTPSEELVAWVLSDCPGVNWTRETASFKDWEFKTARSDWPATWRSWMRKAFDSMQQRRAAGPESFRAQDERIAAESVRRLTGGLAHNRAAVGEAPPREVLPFERGYVKPTTDTIEGAADVRRIR